MVMDVPAVANQPFHMGLFVHDLLEVDVERNVLHWKDAVRRSWGEMLLDPQENPVHPDADTSTTDDLFVPTTL
tara:strand:+ start:168 stop:386 length:219 start_codon:yes stop_codon:yes gene_type:complete